MKDALTYSTISETQFNELIAGKEERPFVVVFTAEWLGEGTIMDAIIEKVASDYSEEMGFWRVAVDELPNVTHRLGIRRLPAVYFFKDGEITDYFAGMMSKKSVEEKIRNVL